MNSEITKSDETFFFFSTTEKRAGEIIAKSNSRMARGFLERLKSSETIGQEDKTFETLIEQ